MVTILFVIPTARASTYAVNSQADFGDANPGNNVCETLGGNGVCTLRAAIQESNGHGGTDSIILQAGTIYLLTRFGEDETALNGDLDVTDSVNIAATGAGAIIDGNGDALLDRIFQVFKCVGNEPTVNGICLSGTVVTSISGLTIRNGRADALGGGIRNDGNLTLTNCLIADNEVFQSFASGGGIHNQGSLSIVNSTIRGNNAVNLGGGLRDAGQSTVITGSTISGNGASRGGGIAHSGLLLNIVNSTISNNFSNNGGGIYTLGGSVSLINSTIARNQAAEGGGVWNGSGIYFEVMNSIISLNEIPTQPLPVFDDCAGTITSQGYNIVSDVISSHCTVNGSRIPGYANLGPLQDNGGPTPTHALLRPSAAIDAVNIGGCTDHVGVALTTDQRGFPRPQGASCDIGAFEASDALFADGFES